jgi:hypothetical protein
MQLVVFLICASKPFVLLSCLVNHPFSVHLNCVTLVHVLVEHTAADQKFESGWL